MKRRLLCFLAAVSLLLSGNTLAAPVRLTTLVPGSCTVTLSIGEHGGIQIGQAFYDGNCQYSAAIGTALTYTLLPDVGYTVGYVSYNGQAVADSIHDGQFFAPALTGMSSLSVVFQPITDQQEYTVFSFSPGGGYGKMADQILPVGVSVALNANTYTRNGYTFAGWESEGQAFQNRQTVTASQSRSFTALWQSQNVLTLKYAADDCAAVLISELIAPACATAALYTTGGKLLELCSVSVSPGENIPVSFPLSEISSAGMLRVFVTDNSCCPLTVSLSAAL